MHARRPTLIVLLAAASLLAGCDRLKPPAPPVPVPTAGVAAGAAAPATGASR